MLFRSTGWVAACTKGGGVIAQALVIAKLLPPIGIVAGAVMVPTLAALALVIGFGRETRGGDLRDLEG